MTRILESLHGFVNELKATKSYNWESDNSPINSMYLLSSHSLNHYSAITQYTYVPSISYASGTYVIFLPDSFKMEFFVGQTIKIKLG